MKKKILYSILFLFGCTNSHDVEFIKSTGWLYYSGYRIIEYMRFDKGDFAIKGDTIFFENKPNALIINLDTANYDLTIKSIKNGEIGHYMDEREMMN